MTSERWQQIARILDRALDLGSEERAAFLDAACTSDPALRREVEALLQAEADAPAFLDEDAARFAAPAFDDPAEGAGRRVGRYRLVEQIGHGGMSVVYRAERADGTFQQQVAVKMLRILGGDPEEHHRRFRAEQQILASLSHPHIAQVFDGGVTAPATEPGGGQPYLVMEYVDGVPLTDYCAARRCSLGARLALFEDVCSAVQHAHQRLIVHRDLKPSNILVTEAGQVKLLDFGIAKLIHPEEILSRSMPMTRVGLRLLTPEYAAPEQVRGETVTTATDVYALGVLLYELLTGTRPYDLSDKTPSEIERVICEQAVTRPSTVKTRAEDSNAVHHVDAERLRGDLDVIVLKALRKEPEARYGAVQELAEDLRRYRDGLPVQARPATTGYRLRKFIRRHRVGTAMTVAFVLVLVGFVVALAIQQRATARERDRAQAETEKARAVTAFMMGLFEASEPGAAPTDTVTARTLLARGVARTEALEGQPDVQAELLAVIGEVYRELGRYDRAAPLLREALALRRRYHGGTHVDVAVSLTHLGELLREQGRFEDAEAAHREALAIRRAVLPPGDVRIGESLNHLGLTLNMQGDYEAAGRYFQDALAMARSQGHPTAHLGSTLNNLALLRQDEGDLPAAVRYLREALDVWRETLGPEHAEVAIGLNNLGLLNSHQGNYAAAESLYGEALTLWRNIYGEDHPYVGMGMNNLGVILDKRGHYAAAESVKVVALDRYRRLLGEEHPEFAKGLGNLAVTKANRGTYAAAESLHVRQLAIERRALGDDHPRVAFTLGNIGYVVGRQGRYAEAERHLREAVRRLRAHHGARHPDVATALERLGVVEMEQGDVAGADSLLRTSLALRRALLDESHPRVAASLDALGRLGIRREAFEEAEMVLTQALAIREARLGPQHADTRATVQHLAALYDAWGKADEAAKYRIRVAEAP